MMGVWQTVKRWRSKLTGKDEWPKINEDWAVGDLAECITEDPWYQGAPGPKKGDVNRVVGVFPGHCKRDETPGWGLKFSKWPGAFAATSFRKITPRADEAQRCEEEFLRLLRPEHVDRGVA